MMIIFKITVLNVHILERKKNNTWIFLDKNWFSIFWFRNRSFGMDEHCWELAFPCFVLYEIILIYSNHISWNFIFSLIKHFAYNTDVWFSGKIFSSAESKEPEATMRTTETTTPPSGCFQSFANIGDMFSMESARNPVNREDVYHVIKDVHVMVAKKIRFTGLITPIQHFKTKLKAIFGIAKSFFFQVVQTIVFRILFTFLTWRILCETW